MDTKSFEEERLQRIRELALVVANGGVWNEEQAREAADLGEIKSILASLDGKTGMAQRIEGQVSALRKKV